MRAHQGLHMFDKTHTSSSSSLDCCPFQLRGRPVSALQHLLSGFSSFP
jgi:hypothetical protein